MNEHYFDYYRQRNLRYFLVNVLDAIKPPSDISVTEWADENRVLPDTAREPGRYRSIRTPYVKRIQDAFTDPEVESISIMGSAQFGKTTILENIIGYIIAINPANILFVAPTLEFGKRFSKTKIEPMIDDTECLREKVSKKKSRDSDNTVLAKKFPGGNLYIVGANSQHSLRGWNSPYIISDDIDSIEIGGTKEGDFIERAEMRAHTFEGMRKLLRASTPTIKGMSRIYNYFTVGTMERWYVPCYFCDEYQVLKFDNVTWEFETDMFNKKVIGTDKPGTAKVACEHCGALMDESHRQEVVLKGKWIAEHPERKKDISFCFDQLASPFSSLSYIAEKMIQAEADPDKDETLHNLVMGIPYEPDKVEEIDEMELMNRVESYLDPARPNEVPSEILFLVASTDVQKDRLETEVWGVGMHKEMWIVGRYKLVGDPKVNRSNPNSVWKQNDKILNNVWKRKDGVQLRVLRAAVDSGYLSQEVYDYTRGREFSEGVWSVKGNKQPMAPILPKNFSKVDNNRTKLLNLGVNLCKQYIFSRLTIENPGARYIHFDQTICDNEYFEQLTAEHGTTKKYGNIEYILYLPKKPGLRNEALDLLVYAVAMAEFVNPNWEKLKKKMDLKAEKVEDVKTDVPDNTKKPEPVKRKKVKRARTNQVANW